ncbi:MAG: MOSC domain-containing protein [Deltaproteobacteria bacterium]|nr:MOSC domain-containing protein [Deltaproteobacteria bacterium]
MSLGNLAEIHRYPVKSMQGERLDQVWVAEDGLRGDRQWAARDEGRGGIEGARKLPALLGCSARYRETVPDAGANPIPEVELPSGKTFSADDQLLARELTSLTGRELTLWPRLPASEDAHYRRGAPDHEDMLEELRAIFARLPDEPLPDLGKLPPVLFTSSTIPGSYFDCFSIFLLSRTALATMQARYPASIFDARRFRPNLLLDIDAAEDFPENAWVGKRLRIGEAAFRIETECPRCAMTTHAFADLPKDPEVMRALVQANAGNLGVYAAVETPGRVREGDSIELIE